MAERPSNPAGTPPSPRNEAPGDDVRPRRDGEASIGGTESAHAAAQAEDLDKVRGAVVGSADMARNVWVLFLSFGTYLAIAVGSVTHRQLLFEEPIRLPLLNVELPLVAFFLVAPLLFLIFHIYLLMHLKLMSDKVQHYNEVVRELGLDRITEDHLRLQLPDFMFVQYLAEPSEGWKSLMHWLLVLVAWLTVIAGPVILLLVIQLQFLPYHDVVITWIQRVIIFIDIILLWWFWLRIAAERRQARAPTLERALIGLSFVIGAVISVGLIGFSFLIAVSPNEYLYGNWVNQNIQIKVEETFFVSSNQTKANLTEYIFEGPVDTVKNRPVHWVSNRLVLPKEHVVDVDGGKQEGGGRRVGEYALSLRGRDLVGAVLNEIDLRQVDLSGAKLRGSWLFAANLQGASLQGTELQGATLAAANLQGARLNNAKLQGARLESATLQGAQLFDAKLQGARLEKAALQGAALTGAHLQCAFLNNAELQGASLDGAHLQGASLDGAQLQDASLADASLWRAYGTPILAEPPRVWVKNPSPQAPTDEQLVQWEKE